MRNVRNFVMVVVAVVLMAGMVTEVVGDLVYTTGTAGSGTIGEAARQAGSYSCDYAAYGPSKVGFTVDGIFRDDVWAIVISEIDGEYVLNGYGRSFDYGPGVIGFEFVMVGNSSNPLVSASQIIYILNDDDPELFWVNTSTGHLTIGLGDDIVLGQETVSINGGEFGDISEIVFDYVNGGHSLNSVEMVTPPVMIDSPENGSVGIAPNTSLIWQGKAGSEFNVHLYDDKGGPVYVFPDLTEESLDVSSYLDWNTTYNWQVDEVIGGVVTYSSPVWTFTTIDYKCQEDIVGDLNGDCIVDLVDFAMFAENWMVEVLKVPDN